MPFKVYFPCLTLASQRTSFTVAYSLTYSRALGLGSPTAAIRPYPSTAAEISPRVRPMPRALRLKLPAAKLPGCYATLVAGSGLRACYLGPNGPRFPIRDTRRLCWPRPILVMLYSMMPYVGYNSGLSGVHRAGFQQQGHQTPSCLGYKIAEGPRKCSRPAGFALPRPSLGISTMLASTFRHI